MQGLLLPGGCLPSGNPSLASPTKERFFSQFSTKVEHLKKECEKPVKPWLDALYRPSLKRLGILQTKQ